MRTSWTNDGHVQLLSRIQTETDMDIPLRGVRVCLELSAGFVCLFGVYFCCVYILSKNVYY